MDSQVRQQAVFRLTSGHTGPKVGVGKNAAFDYEGNSSYSHGYRRLRDGTYVMCVQPQSGAGDALSATKNRAAAGGANTAGNAPCADDNLGDSAHAGYAHHPSAEQT